MTMKKIEEMTIPELVEAWNFENMLIKAEATISKPDRFSALSRALDAKCEEAGISLQNKGVEFHRLNAWQMDYATMSRPVAVFIDNAADLHALLGYLLDKQR